MVVNELLEKWPIKGYCLSFISDVLKFETVGNNMCEIFNEVFFQTRSKPIISLFEDIRQYVMNKIVVKIAYVIKWKRIVWI